MVNSYIHTFRKGRRTMWNANSLVQDLILGLSLFLYLSLDIWVYMCVCMSWKLSRYIYIYIYICVCVCVCVCTVSGKQTWLYDDKLPQRPGLVLIMLQLWNYVRCENNHLMKGFLAEIWSSLMMTENSLYIYIYVCVCVCVCASIYIYIYIYI